MNRRLLATLLGLLLAALLGLLLSRCTAPTPANLCVGPRVESQSVGRVRGSRCP